MRRALHDSDDPAAQVSRSLADADPPVREALDNETARQRVQIELIASENVMSRAVREALGHEIGNKTLEGYPGNRFHGGGEYVDVVERLANRARKETLRGRLCQRAAALWHAGEPGGVPRAPATRRPDPEPRPRGGRPSQPRRRDQPFGALVRLPSLRRGPR